VTEKQNPTPNHDPDIYQGISWRERAALPALGAVLDPADTRGLKNRYLDRLHRRTVRKFLTKLQRQHGGRFQRAMDFGCGTGRLLDELLNVAAEVVGVDRTPEMIERAQQLGIVPPQRLVVWRDGPLPFEDASIDLIMSVYVMMTTETLDLAATAWPRVCSQRALGLLIEQVDNSRGLTRDRYEATLAAAGFRTLLARPIRRGARSPFQRIAASLPWPLPMIDLFAEMEIKSMRGLSLGADARGYWDYVFLVQRSW
jgi:SAM-dependent methyltransferase